MIKFIKCTYKEYQNVWLRERVENFLAIHYNAGWTLEQFVQQFLSIYEKENEEQVTEVFRKILKK